MWNFSLNSVVEFNVEFRVDFQIGFQVRVLVEVWVEFQVGVLGVLGASQTYPTCSRGLWDLWGRQKRVENVLWGHCWFWGRQRSVEHARVVLGSFGGGGCAVVAWWLCGGCAVASVQILGGSNMLGNVHPPGGFCIGHSRRAQRPMRGNIETVFATSRDLAQFLQIPKARARTRTERFCNVFVDNAKSRNICRVHVLVQCVGK